MSCWLDRVKDEAEDLKSKVSKLEEFLLSKTSYAISVANQLQIMRDYQLPAMKLYLNALGERIAKESVRRVFNGVVVDE